MVLQAQSGRTTVFIDGIAGTTGLSLQTRLEHPDFSEIFTLLKLPEKDRKTEQARLEMMDQADITVLCLPDKAALEAAILAEKTRTRLLDASSAHRVAKDWVYGLPELEKGQAQKIASALKVSNPGCYATGAVAILRPLTQAGLIPASYPVSLYGISGYSGGGKEMIACWEGEKSPSFELYGLSLEHKHLPEIQKYAGLDKPPLFLPSVGKFAQGMVVISLFESENLRENLSCAEICDILQLYYEDFKPPSGQGIKVMPYSDSESLMRLSPDTMAGRDDLILRVHGKGSGRFAISAHFDNLGKGAAGAAVRNLLLMRKGRTFEI